MRDRAPVVIDAYVRRCVFISIFDMSIAMTAFFLFERYVLKFGYAYSLLIVYGTLTFGVIVVSVSVAIRRNHPGMMTFWNAGQSTILLVSVFMGLAGLVVLSRGSVAASHLFMISMISGILSALHEHGRMDLIRKDTAL